ncbi:MAG: hypothetical protein HZA52_16360 [Planctomycetes bacterium]|nr:hypothetical protein [Planctomycetota bacterium]
MIEQEQRAERGRRVAAALPNAAPSAAQDATSNATSNAAQNAAQSGASTPPATEPGEAPDAWLERMLFGGAQVFRHLRVLAHVRADRGRLALRRALQRVQRELLVWLALATATVAGVVALATGLAGALTAAFGERAWAGQLAAAALLLGAAAGIVVLRRARAERAELERHRTKYARLDRNPFQPERGPAPSNGGGAARSSGAEGPQRVEARPAARRE